MTVKIDILTNFPQVTAALNRVADDVGNKAMVRALNATVDQGKTQMARQISKEFNITTGKAKERLVVRKARARGGVLRFEATLEATRRGQGRSLNLIAFVEKSTTLAEHKRRSKAGEGRTHTLRNGGKVILAEQLRFKIKRSGGKKIIKGAFIGNDGRTVFIRSGKSQLPIEAKNTIDIPQMFNAKRVNIIVRDVMLKRFETNFQRELRSVLKGYVK